MEQQMNQKDMVKTTRIMPKRKPSIAVKIDEVLDRNFAAPWIDRGRQVHLRRHRPEERVNFGYSLLDTQQRPSDEDLAQAVQWKLQRAWLGDW